MQPRGYNDLHLTYCSNIHPGERWDAIFEQLDEHVPRLKRELSSDRRFGIGLRLGHEAAVALSEKKAMASFKGWLDRHDCYVFTINGFPYGSFHGGVVKDDVYRPDWRTDERVAYTHQLIQILAELLPSDCDGSISTSPISYKPWLDASATEEAFRKGALNLAKLTGDLVRLRRNRGTFIHLGIEPEPDCLIENTAETVVFFQDWLLTLGAEKLASELGYSKAEARSDLLEHIRVCYDTCHFAVEYESPQETFEAFEETGIKLSKIQLSAALKIALQDKAPSEIEQALRPFAESTYLHQVVERRRSGELIRYPDLPDALDQLPTQDAIAWRIHYHVPLFVDSYGALESTQEELIDSLNEVLSRNSCSHFELETYTWEVLPDELQADLGTSIQREFEWILTQFSQQ